MATNGIISLDMLNDFVNFKVIIKNLIVKYSSSQLSEVPKNMGMNVVSLDIGIHPQRVLNLCFFNKVYIC